MVRMLVGLSVPAALLAVASAAPVPKPGPKPLYYYPTTVGDTWVVGGATDTVIAVEQKNEEYIVTVVRSEIIPGKIVPRKMTRTMAVSEKGVCELGNSRSDPPWFDRPVCYLALPVKSGEKWQGIIGLRTAYEPKEITVKAGKFMAIKVEEDIPQAVPSRSIDWYAPGVGRVRWCQTVNGVEKNIEEMTAFVSSSTSGSGDKR